MPRRSSAAVRTTSRRSANCSSCWWAGSGPSNTCGVRDVARAPANGARSGVPSAPVRAPEVLLVRSPMLTLKSLTAVQDALAEAGADGWLLYDFRGLNPIAHAMLRLEGMVSRRGFAWGAGRGTPGARTHAL